jgi:hypothetical protein
MFTHVCVCVCMCARVSFITVVIMATSTEYLDFELSDSAFEFYSSLLQNVLKRFVSLKEFLPAQLVCFVAQRVIKTSSHESAYAKIEAGPHAHDVAAWEADFMQLYPGMLSSRDQLPHLPMAFLLRRLPSLFRRRRHHHILFLVSLNFSSAY